MKRATTTSHMQRKSKPSKVDETPKANQIGMGTTKPRPYEETLGKCLNPMCAFPNLEQPLVNGHCFWCRVFGSVIIGDADQSKAHSHHPKDDDE